MPTVHARSLCSGRLLWDSVQAQWFLQGKQGHRLYPKEFSWSRNNLTTSTISSEWKLREMVRSKNWHLMNILLLNQCDMVTCCVCMWLRECTCPVEFWKKKEALWQQTVHHKICEYWKQNEKLWDWISPFSGNHQPWYLWHLTKKSFS